MGRLGFVCAVILSFCNPLYSDEKPQTLGVFIVLFSHFDIEKPAMNLYSKFWQRFYDRSVVIESPPGTAETLMYSTKPEYLGWRLYVGGVVGKALREADQVDLFIIGHGVNSRLWLADTVGSMAPRKLRLIYNSGCEEVGEGEDKWAQMSQTYVAYPGLDVGPIHTTFFLAAWFAGAAADRALGYSNLATRVALRDIPITQNTDGVLFGNKDLTVHSTESQAYSQPQMSADLNTFKRLYFRHQKEKFLPEPSDNLSHRF